jgi:hypothetical protein
MRQNVRLQHAQKGGNMSGCNMLKKTATCPAATCSKRRQHVRLQHAQKGGNMSGCNMLKKTATCPAATCSIKILSSVADSTKKIQFTVRTKTTFKHGKIQNSRKASKAGQVNTEGI